ncbi:velvet factor-domain-containing protein [Aspergillus californicus]
MAARAPVPTKLPSETDAFVSRKTREGKNITYRLHVLQQPERARACGAGAKSSADRRPVDPPPVVSMQIFESDPLDDTHQTDITSSYGSSNFFLFATLETARTMAHGRLVPTPSCPVLTGVPVAAGYFIFPDLSVRHEGNYRLHFNLFEQTKDPKNHTHGTEDPAPPIPGKLSAPQEFLEYRLEVMSKPFTVYSAKKFPGLTTSTNLSRIIAEQGCRVRIRRDVRMRRRGDKRSDDYGYDDERTFSNRHSDRYTTPDAYAANPSDRPRSTSMSTVDHAFDSYPNQHYHRKPQAFHRQMPSVPGPSSTTPIPSAAPLPLVPPSSTPSPASATAPSLPPAPIAVLPQIHTPSHLAFASTQTHYQAPQLSNPPPPPAAVPPSMYPRHSISHGRNPSIGAHHDPSTNYPYSHERPNYAKPLPPMVSELYQPTEYSNNVPRPQTPSTTGTLLPSIKSLVDPRYEPWNSVGSSPINDYSAKPYNANPSSSKRTHEATFGADDQRLVNGMRPSTESNSGGGMQRRPSHGEDSHLYAGMTYKRANGNIVTRRRKIDLMSSVPSLRPPDRSIGREFNLDTDYTQANHQLQRSLESTCHDPNPHDPIYPSRKYRHPSPESDFPSEESGQFDDADAEIEAQHLSEPPLPKHTGLTFQPANSGLNGSPSPHLRRRRSNDWPRQPVDKDINERSTRQRWPFHYHSRHSGSPRSPRHSYGRSGRRSRFVEGHMNDTVSEKPPSIFLRDGVHNGDTSARGGSRQSGIFRFGKAIASAFMPFGGWGSVSEIWRGSADANAGDGEGADGLDRLAQVERAYEELKRSGYQGTAKGSYMQSLAAGGTTNLPDETWRSIQEKMAYGSRPANTGGQHSRQSSGQAPSQNGSVSVSSLRPSFPDLNLRKAKSSLGITPKRNEGALQNGQEVRHQKSRKDMQRQAKLLKRVSNLEDKLERARRELRDLTGEDELLLRSLQEDRPHQRKFIPGALPSLPSERLLHEGDTMPLSPRAAPTEQNPDTGINTLNQTPPEPPKPPAGLTVSQPPRSRSTSRKRKSLDPDSREAPDVPIPRSPHIQEDPVSEPHELEETKTPPSRMSKLPKTARGDSPASVERNQRQLPAEDRSSRPLRSTNARNRSATPVLRVKRGRGDLRSTASPRLDEDKENQSQRSQMQQDAENNVDFDKDTVMLQGDTVQAEEQENPQDDENTSCPSPSIPSRRRARYEYIPPVPPLPTELAATAAKVDRRLAREIGKRRVHGQRESEGNETGSVGVRERKGFQWPEDIF